MVLLQGPPPGRRARRRREHIGRPVDEVGGPLGRHHEHGRGAVALPGAVIEPVRLGHEPGLLVTLGVERLAVGGGVGVALRVVVGGPGHGEHGGGGDAVGLEHPLRAQGADLDGPVNAVDEILGGGVGLGDGHPQAGPALLGQRPVHGDDVGLAGNDGRRRQAERPGNAATVAPDQRPEAQLLRAERRHELLTVVALGAVGDEPVDVARGEAGVLAGGHDGPQAQLHFRIGRRASSVERCLTDPDDRGGAAEWRSHASDQMIEG
jgi:hypothetical protein